MVLLVLLKIQRFALLFVLLFDVESLLKRFGMTRTKVSITAFKGRQAISDLIAYPLQYHVESVVSH
jgi:hypothetical protein